MINEEGFCSQVDHIEEELDAIFINAELHNRFNILTRLKTDVSNLHQVLDPKSRPEWLDQLHNLISSSDGKKTQTYNALMPIHKKVIQFDRKDFFASNSIGDFISIEKIFKQRLAEGRFGEAYQELIEALKTILKTEGVTLSKKQIVDLQMIINSIIKSKTEGIGAIHSILRAAWAFITTLHPVLAQVDAGVRLYSTIKSSFEKAGQELSVAVEKANEDVKDQFVSDLDFPELLGYGRKGELIYAEDPGDVDAQA